MNNVIMEKLMIRSTLLIAVMMWLVPATVIAQPHLVLDSAEQDHITQTLVTKTMALLLAMDNYSRTGNADFGDDDGVHYARAILENRELRIARDTLYSQVIRVGSDGFELRQLFMQYGQTANEFVELVARFDLQGNLVNVEVANELQNVNRVLSRAVVADQADRQQVEQVLERLAAAFSNKDAESLSALFDMDALIISGVVRNNQTIFTRTDRDGYLRRMESTIFPNNESVNVTFDQIEVYVNPGNRNVFGVSLYQIWNTTNYSDEGYMALMLDLRNTENPRVISRSWQPIPITVEQSAQFEPKPLNLVMFQGDITPSETGYLNIAIHSDDVAILNPGILKNWIENKNFEISGVLLRAEDAEFLSQNELRIPFVAKDIHAVYEDLLLQIYDTELLSSLRAQVRMVPGYGHYLDLYVFHEDDDIPHSTKSYADVLIEGGPQGTQVTFKELPDSIYVADYYLDNDILFLRIPPGEYRFRAMKEGFVSREVNLTLHPGDVKGVQFGLNHIQVPLTAGAHEVADESEDQVKPGFYTRNRMLVWAAVAAITISAAAVLVSDGSGSDAIVFPPPPGRP